MTRPDLSIFDAPTLTPKVFEAPAPYHDARCETWQGDPCSCRGADGHTSSTWADPVDDVDAYPHIAEGA